MNSTKTMPTKMKSTKGLCFALPVALLTLEALGQTWQTVDNLQYVAGSAYNQARAAAVDAHGNVYFSGEGYDVTGVMHAVVMGSSDHGDTWIPLEDFTASTNRQNQFNALGFDAAQNLYAIALSGAMGRPSNPHLIVRKSPDLGATWSTALDFALAGYNSQAGSPGFAADSAGRIFVATWGDPLGSIVLRSGDAIATWSTLHPFADKALVDGILNTPSGLFVCGSADSLFGAVLPYVMWGTVRKSVDGGATWTSVDTYNPPGFTGSGLVQAICADASGNIYVGGWANITTGKGRNAVTKPYCVIRKGTNGGSKWQTVATLPIPGTEIGNLALGFDSAGGLYAGGALGIPDYGLLKSLDAGVTWNVVDSFPFNPMCFACDNAGAVYFGGFATSTAGLGAGEHWIVRKQ